MRYLSIILLMSIYSTAMGQTYTGRVVEKDNIHKGIPFARIHIKGPELSVHADSTGNFSISGIPEGHQEIEVTAFGYEPFYGEFHFEPDQPILIFLEIGHRDLDKVIISSSGELQGENITNVEYHPLSDLNKIPGTLGESFTNIPGVHQSSLGSGISKPVIRGLSGSRVVTYVNGLRVENQQWGGDHGLPITDLGIGSVEVIKGPASLLYGSDALGGVLYFVDEPFLPVNEKEGFVRTRFDSNTGGTTNAAGYKFSNRQLRVNLYGGYDNYADYQLANGNYAANSRYQQYSGKMALGYHQGKYSANFRYTYYHGRYGLPGHTHDSVPDPSSFQNPDPSRALNVPAQVVDNHYAYLENKFYFNENLLVVAVGNTMNKLVEFEEKFTIPEITMYLNTTTYNVRWKSMIFNHRLTFIGGIQGMYQHNTNDPDVEEELIPNARLSDAGIYAVMRGNLGTWKFSGGARYDYRFITADTSGGETSFQFTGFNYSAGMMRSGDKSTLRLNVSTGFRAPHTSELLTDGVHHGAFRYEIGTIDLKTERATQFDLSWGLHFEDLELILNPFYNRISDYIYLEKTDSIQEGFDVYQYSQVNFAQLFGGDIGFHYHPHFAHHLHLEASASTVFAEDENKNPLNLIPQSRINSRVSYAFNKGKKFILKDLDVQYIYFFKQNRTGVLETETPAYQILNLGINFEIDISTPLQISLGVKNLLNENYFDHLSALKTIGLNAPGINIYTSLKIEL